MAKDSIINWQAKEYIERKKTTGWYVGLALVTAGLIALSIWLQYWTFLAVIVVAVIDIFPFKCSRAYDALLFYVEPCIFFFKVTIFYGYSD